jgi:hypothetical protein
MKRSHTIKDNIRKRLAACDRERRTLARLLRAEKPIGDTITPKMLARARVSVARRNESPTSAENLCGWRTC